MAAIKALESKVAKKKLKYDFISFKKHVTAAFGELRKSKEV